MATDPVVTSKKEPVRTRLAKAVSGFFKEHDNVTKSSARLQGTIILVNIEILQAIVVIGWTWVLVSMSKNIKDVYTAQVCTTLINATLRIVIWGFLFQAAIALSLYGINVWKYIVSLRTGVSPVPDSEGESASEPASTPLARLFAAVEDKLGLDKVPENQSSVDVSPAPKSED